MIVQERAGLFLLEAADPVSHLESQIGKAGDGFNPPPGIAGLRQPRDLAELRPGTKSVPVIAKGPRELHLVDRRQSGAYGASERQQNLAREVILIRVGGD